MKESVPNGPEKTPDLTYEEFIAITKSKHKRYINFTSFFISDFMNDDLYYTKFIEEGNASLDKEITDLLDEVRDQHFDLESEGWKLNTLEKKLYDAYLMMRSYGASNEFLLGLA